MIKNIFFWGAKYKAGIIHDLIENNKIKEDTKNLFVVGGTQALEIKNMYLQYPALPY